MVHEFVISLGHSCIVMCTNMRNFQGCVGVAKKIMLVAAHSLGLLRTTSAPRPASLTGPVGGVLMDTDKSYDRHDFLNQRILQIKD